MTVHSTYQFTIKSIAALAVFMCATGTIYAQATDAKRALSVRVIAAQEGPELNRLYEQLAASATQQVVANWNPRLDAMPEDKRQAAANALDAELKKFNDDALKLVSAQSPKARESALIPAYIERFSEDELKQLVALMEAPVFKKYQTIAPELGSVFVKAIVDGTRGAVEARSKVFDTAAAKIVGTTSAPAASPTAPAASPTAPAKPAPAKKP
jgi:uncharacterized protein